VRLTLSAVGIADTRTAAAGSGEERRLVKETSRLVFVYEYPWSYITLGGFP
jgi:hypothetical protein